MYDNIADNPFAEHIIVTNRRIHVCWKNAEPNYMPCDSLYSLDIAEEIMQKAYEWQNFLMVFSP